MESATEPTTAELTLEAGRILSRDTMKLATREHILALRNVIAEAYRLLHQAQHQAVGTPPSMADIMAWKRTAGLILDASVR